LFSSARRRARWVPASSLLTGTRRSPDASLCARLRSSARRLTRIVDLSHTLHPAMPYWPGAGYGPFRYAAINVLERDGKAAGVFEMPEHMGTHVDAPKPFVDSPLSVDRLLPADLLRPAVVFDIAARAAADAGALLSVDDVVASEHRPWPGRRGRGRAGAQRLVRALARPVGLPERHAFFQQSPRRSRPAHSIAAFVGLASTR